MPFSACPKRYWHAPSESGTSMQETIPPPSLSYQIPIQIFLAILCLIVILSCVRKYFRRNIFGNPRSPAWAPIWARRKSSGLQFATNMRTWDLERNQINDRKVIDSTKLIHRERVDGEAQDRLQIDGNLKQIVSDTKPYDVVLRQLERSFQEEPRSPM